MNTYLLIASRAESINGGYVAAREIVRRRLEALQWPLFKNTPHQGKLVKGDRLIVYVAGEKDRCFVASASVVSLTNGRDYDADGPEALTNAPFQTLNIDQVCWFAERVPISAIRNLLDFVPKGTNKWGCVLQRGLKAISPKDAALILKSI